MSRFLIDTNILVSVFKGDAAMKSYIESLDASIDTTVYSELIQGSKDLSEVLKIEKYLTRFGLVYFHEGISRRTIELLRTFSKSHGLMFGDAIIAATCIEEHLSLITLNVRDFKFIESLEVVEPQR